MVARSRCSTEEAEYTTAADPLRPFSNTSHPQLLREESIYDC